MSAFDKPVRIGNNTTHIITPRVNNQIRATQLRVIDADGKNLGVLSLDEALRLAKERGADLIEIAPDAEPPVARLMDYGKFIYQQEKQERKKRAKERGDTLKTIRLTFGMGLHDMLVRAKQSEEFLKEHPRLQIEMRLKGRQKAHPEVGRQKIEEFVKLLPPTVKILQERKLPNGFILLIAKQ